MDTAPQVSVVLPVHRTAPEFLREAIESVKAQRNVRWELVIVLDAASAACARVAREAAALDPDRVRVVGTEGGTPRGLSGARNLGVAETRGPRIGFLDADDVIEPDSLATRLAAMEARPEAAMVVGSSLFWHSWTGDAADRGRDYVPALGLEPGTVYPPPSFVPRFLGGRGAIPCTCSILVNRAAIDAIGGFDESFRDLYEDQAFYARLGLRFPVLAEEHVLDRYRQHPESMTARAGAGQAQAARARFLDWLEQELTAMGVHHPDVQRAIARERWKLRHPRLARILRTARRARRLLVSVTSRRARGTITTTT
jgi:glycosyltransferase involved in cell wall biosynthesis